MRIIARMRTYIRYVHVHNAQLVFLSSSLSLGIAAAFVRSKLKFSYIATCLPVSASHPVPSLIFLYILRLLDVIWIGPAISGGYAPRTYPQALYAPIYISSCKGALRGLQAISTIASRQHKNSLWHQALPSPTPN